MRMKRFNHIFDQIDIFPSYPPLWVEKTVYSTRISSYYLLLSLLALHSPAAQANQRRALACRCTIANSKAPLVWQPEGLLIVHSLLSY